MIRTTTSSRSISVGLLLPCILFFVFYSSSTFSSLSNNNNNYLFSLAQSTAASLTGASVFDVDRTRLWIKDTQGGQFRPSNGSAPNLPRYANTSGLSSSVAYMAKHSALYDSTMDRVIIFGGEQHDAFLAPFDNGANRPLGSATNRVLIYDIRSNQFYSEPTFSPATQQPVARMHHIAWFHSSGGVTAMMVHGGIGDDTKPTTWDAAFSDVWKYQNRSWSEFNVTAAPTPKLYGHTVVAYNNKAYIFGGTSGRKFYNTLYEVDTTNLKQVVFTEVAQLGEVPRARAFHAAALSFNTITGAEMLISGGHDGLNPMDDLYSFNLFTRRWKLLTRSKSDGARDYDRYDTVRIAGVAVPPLSHHSCSSQFPILLCVGGSSTQPLVNEYDIALGRWIRSYTRDVSLPPVVNSRSFIRVSDETGLAEMWMVGGLTGETRRFVANNNFAIVKTNVFTEACPARYVNPDFATGRCFSCPAGTVVIPERDPHRCLQCAPGTYEANGVCNRCPSGTYNPKNATTNVTSCVACPAGTFTIGDGADSLADCTTCPLGTYADPPQCVPCPAGSYGTSAGQEGYDRGCAPCAYGSYSAPGATVCTQCPPGASSGAFQERADPNYISLHRMDVIYPLQLLPGACPAQQPAISQVVAGTYFYVVVNLGDVGGPNNLFPYHPLRQQISGVWLEPNPRLTVEYDGTPTRMYYDCPDNLNLVPTCSSVVRNQTTPFHSGGVQALGCHQWYQWFTGFTLRFDDPTTEPVTLTIRSTPSYLHPLQLKFQVVAFGTAIEIIPVASLYVATQSIPTTIRALDLLNRFDAGASDSVTISVVCATGTPALLINGVVSGSFTFANGVHQPNIGFSSRAENCRFRYNRNGVTTNDPTVFTIQEGQNLVAATSSANMTNGGWIQVTCELRDITTGNTMFGDNISTLKLDIVNNSFTPFWNIKPRDFEKRVIAGVAQWSFQIYSAYPVPTTIQPAFFNCSHTSGATSLLPTVSTNTFNLGGKVNGTEIRLNTAFGGWPAVIAANETFKVSFERIDPLTGAIDGSVRLARIQLELFNCPGVRLHTANSSSPFFYLVHGRATVSVKFVGPDTTNCAVLVREVSQPDPEKRLKAYWTPYFDISTPTYLSHDGCAFAACATCQVGVGKIIVFTVKVHTAAGAIATKDHRTVVRLQLTGNASGAVETTGVYEKRVSNGQTTFSVQFLPSTVPTGLLFVAGRWVAEPVYNITYQTTPVFKELKFQTGETPVFYRGVVRPIYTCPMLLDQSATRLRLIGRMPRWFGSGDFVPLNVEAITDFGSRAVGYNQPFTVAVTNCHGGVYYDTQFRFLSSSVANTVVTNYVTGDNFQSSLANFNMSLRYSTQSHFTAGLRNCSIRVRSGALPELVVEGFEVNRVFRSCRMCAPGRWSAGGNGVTPLTTFHPGGCVKCLVGTFSTTSGATDESQCEVCSVGDGYIWSAFEQNEEGRTSCAQCGVLNTTVGLPGGGGCPAGNIQQCGANNGDNIADLYLGRNCRRCTLSQCIVTTPCPAGQYRLFCTSYGANQVNCEGAWNQGKCAFVSGACTGASGVCVNCPAGTVGRFANNNNYFTACTACGAGQYSETAGLTTATQGWQYEQWYCPAFTQYPVLCTGTGVFSCPNGTYAPNQGQASNASCLVCPAGTYAHQVPVHNYVNCPGGCSTVDPPLGQSPISNPYCTWPPGNCYRCPLATRNSGSSPIMVAPAQCTPCPPGTYNSEAGMWDPSHCKPCRAGTYCPQGSFSQNATDPNATLALDLTGFTPPQGVTFEKAGSIMSCANRFVSDYAGYVQDGGMDNWVRRYYVVPDTLGSSYRNEWADGGGRAPYHYDREDRSGSASSGSLRCNATGCLVHQNISVNQELPEELVVRLWVKLRSPNASVPYGTGPNLAVLYQNNPAFVVSSFAGFNVTFYSHWNSLLATNITSVSASINVSASGADNWTLIEVVYNPPFPVKIATFALEARGWYNLDVLFDDAALRPSGDRICNCSTGFYFNASNPGRRCLRCPPGFMCAGGILKRCVNSWSNSGEPGCHECRPNWECDADGRGRSISCPKYTYKSNATETCERCPNGYACQDGYLVECSGGRYGDGGLECKVCSPGYYSLVGAPRVECLRCPPGTTSNAMRTGCFQCPIDHFSEAGLQCEQCPAATYAPFVGSTACRPCDALFLQAWNYTVYRNSQTMLEVLPKPCACIEDYAWRIEAVHHVSGQGLGEPARSLSTKRTIRYTAGPAVGKHVFRVHLTSNDGATLQVAIITVDIDNRAPVAVSDPDLVLVHPIQTTTYNLTSLLFNDYDLDLDNLYFATLTAAGSQYNATGLTIAPDRRTASVTLPPGFKGPALFQYTIMDQFYVSPALCIAPACKISGVASVRLTSKRVGPVAVDDKYDVLNGQVYSLDVTANDYDVDGDDIYVSSTTLSVNGANPQPSSTCSVGCAVACLGVAGCTCAFDVERNRCYPSTGRATTVQYTAPTSICGTDQFTYTIATNDGTSTATVFARIRRCYCASHNPPIYFQFVLDGTTGPNDFAHQLAYVDAVQKRSLASSNDFRYAIYVAGINTAIVNFTNSYISTQDLQWPEGAANYPYNLGDAINKLPAAANWAATLPASRILATIYVSSRESLDSVVDADANIKAAYSNKNVAISVDPKTGSAYNHALRLNPRYNGVFTSFDQLITADTAAQNTMDEICSL